MRHQLWRRSAVEPGRLSSPLDRKNLLHHLLAGLRQVLLVVGKFSCGTFTRVHLAVLRRGVKAIDEVACRDGAALEERPIVRSRLKAPTEGVDEVLLANQLHVVVDGFRGQRVLSEDQRLLLPQTLHLSTSQVSQELLQESRGVSVDTSTP